MRRPRPRFIVGLLLTPLLAGCFASGDGGSSSSGSCGPRDGARLRVVMAFLPAEKFSPYGEDACHLSRLGVSEGLTQLNANGTAAPALAQSWNSENGGRSWLFTLRDAKFQDGSEVTPDTVVTALTRATQAKPEPVALSGVKLSAEAVGDNQVRVRTAAPGPVPPLRLSNPRLAVYSPKEYAKQGTVNPAGTATGPFELKKITGQTAASLDKETVREKPTARNVVLDLNTKPGPFAEPRLRAAAREAIDPSLLAKDVYEGYAAPGQDIYSPALNWAAGKRVEPKGRAKATEPNGTSVTIATYSSRPGLPEVAQVLQQQLDKAGFKVKLEVRDLARFESDAPAVKFDATVYARNVLAGTGAPSPSSPATTPARAATTSPSCATRRSTRPSPSLRPSPTPASARTPSWRPRPPSPPRTWWFRWCT